MIKKWVFCISGYRQNYTALTGMDLLFQRLLPYQSTTTRVDYWTWDEDWKQIAALMHRHADRECEFIGACYSWGAGSGAVGLADALRQRGRVVERMFLADPVYRRKWVPRWFNLLPTSMMDGRVIEFPSTVKLIDWWYQREDKPAGHKPVGAREVRAGVKVELPHAAMDEHEDFQRAVLDAALA